jgi:ribosomal protein S18 acetylase RimI-like enzyme
MLALPDSPPRFRCYDLGIRAAGRVGPDGGEWKLSLTFRTFRNTDPPQILRIWNAGLSGRSAAYLQSCPALEVHVFSKPFFDRNGLFIAEDNGQVVAFAHAGFGPDHTGAKLDHRLGIVCLIVVHPKYQRRGIGSELLRCCENYLRHRGAQSIFAGGQRPRSPFYWGLYGGCEMPGLLLSDVGADFFFQSHGYRQHESVLVYQRPVDGPLLIQDPRFTSIKRKYEVRVLPRPVSQRWYDECTFAPLEMLHFQLQEIATGAPLAWVRMWDMDAFAWRWHQPAVGLIDLEVKPVHRQKGLGKFLMANVLRYIQEQFYALIEVQTPSGNTPAQTLFQKLGFRQVDEGRVYSKDLAHEAARPVSLNGHAGNGQAA